MESMQEISLSVGEEIFLKKGLITQIRLVYAGMPGPGHFSFATVMIQGQSGHSVNLYWPRDTRRLRLHGRDISIIQVAPDSIRFMFV